MTEKKDTRFFGKDTQVWLVLAIGFIIHTLFEFLLSAFSESLTFIHQNEWSVKITIIALSLMIASLIEYLIRLRAERTRDFTDFKTEFREFQKQEKEILQYIIDIKNQNIQPIINKKIKEIEVTQQADFNKNISVYLEKWKNKTNDFPKWRLIFERIINSSKVGITNNKISLSLETYLDSILDITDVMLEEGNKNGNGLVIHSFTNALPIDWFKREKTLVSKKMETYNDALKERIAKMKKSDKNDFKRYVICSESLSYLGIKKYSEVVKSWHQLDTEFRPIYINDLHTSPENALVANFHNHIKFVEDYTEIIYFGFNSGGTPIWEFCFCCSYTNTNLSVTASFIDLKEYAERLLISVPNVTKLNFYNNTLLPPENLEINFSEFPNYVLNEQIADLHKVQNILTLAEKWDLASRIWHNQKENDEILDYLTQSLSLNNTHKILDCACGTGEHSILLKQANFDITAVDYDKKNIEIFQEKQKNLGITIPSRDADWLTIDTIFPNQKFDFILCLGSSITYYESWDEEFTKDKLTPGDKTEIVIEKLKNLLTPTGKLVFGVSRHYDKRVKGTTINFRTFPEKPKANETSYDMTWILEFDWDKRIKKWISTIHSSKEDDYSFELVSHLYDIEELMDICKKVFPNPSTVDFKDIDNSSYDVYIVCSLQ